MQNSSRQRWWLRRLVNRLEIDRATFFALTLRGWQLAGGALTVFLIASFFSPAVQGYYYTFGSLLALQTFFELGLNIAVINVCSHEWSRLELSENGEIEGDPESLSRLVSLGRFLARWYAMISLLFIIGVGLGGSWFLAQDRAAISWQGPWIAAVVLTGGLLWTLPFTAILEGCNQIVTVNQYRTLQAILYSLFIWGGILLGWGLWSIAAGIIARLFVDLWMLGVRYRRFFQAFWRSVPSSTFHWKEDILPFQGRLGAQAILAYCSYSLFTPVLFRYHGAETAGQMGMTWAVLTAFQSAALAWVYSRVPRFGILIARQEYSELDRIFLRLLRVSLGILIGMMGVFLIGLQLLEESFPDIAVRFLGLLPTALFMLGMILWHFPNCAASYLRAHKQEPLLGLHLISHPLMALLIVLLGRKYGGTGAAAAYAGVTAMLILPGTYSLWARCRREWHLPRLESQ